MTRGERRQLPAPVVEQNAVTDKQCAGESIRQMAARKADMVKIWLDGAGGLMPKVPPEVYSAVIDEAHKNDLRVAAHIYDLDDAKAIVRAGVDVIAHGVRDKPVDAEFIDMMKARSVWYISTIVLDYTGYVFAEQPSWTREPFLQRALHPAVRAQFDDPAYRERTLALPATAKNRAAVTTNKQNLKALHDAGVRLGFGSDSGVGLRIPGVAEHLELALMVEAGLTPMQAITNATSNAAALLKLGDRGVWPPASLPIWWSSRAIQLPTSAIRGRFTRSGIAASRRRDRSRRSRPESAATIAASSTLNARINLQRSTAVGLRIRDPTSDLIGRQKDPAGPRS
jgi:hypothetical protein